MAPKLCGIGLMFLPAVVPQHTAYPDLGHANHVYSSPTVPERTLLPGMSPILGFRSRCVKRMCAICLNLLLLANFIALVKPPCAWEQQQTSHA